MEKYLKTDVDYGLNEGEVARNRKLYGENVFEKAKRKNILKKILSAFSEPMILILIFALILTVGTGIGKSLKTGEKDFSGAIGVASAILISVGITLFMEGSSEKAFEKLKKEYSDAKVRVIRNGRADEIEESKLVVGDLVCIEDGSKVFADGHLVGGGEIAFDESALSGESREVRKSAHNGDYVYSGTFVLSGSGKYVVDAVGKNAQIGKIASELAVSGGSSPLFDKLSRMGKTVTAVGAVFGVLTFIFTVVKSLILKSFSFDVLSDAFLSSVILIVAVVPEGLSTIVAVSLAINMNKLSKRNVLIKKLTATDTAGAVSVICTDKTGTLTENKMTVDRLCFFSGCGKKDVNFSKNLEENFCINTTADIVKTGDKIKKIGSPTECALLEAFEKEKRTSYTYLRNEYAIIKREAFSSERKYMSTTVDYGGKEKTYVKGAPEKIISFVTLSYEERKSITDAIKKEERKGKRVLAFASVYENKISFDGFVSIVDPVRKGAKEAIKECKKAGIKIMMLTGDNVETATEIAKELDISDGKNGIYTANELENFSEEELKKKIDSVKVVARSTPFSKLKLVNVLKNKGEVVAVTGDGINDAPAIKSADIGIAMGDGGSEITKEASDVVLLDNSFSSIVGAVTFGRKLYENIQKFVTFQLTVNLSALLLVVISLLAGTGAPFTTLQLLWINVIMDGPPALSLGLGTSDKGLMDREPIRRTAPLLTKSMAIRIILQGLICVAICVLQSAFNFLGVSEGEKNGAVFMLFTTIQLFNAFNCIEIGKKSIFKSLKYNKIMLAVFGITFSLQLFICTVFPQVFGVNGISGLSVAKILCVSVSVILLSEFYKFVYRKFKKVRYSS